MPHAFPAVWSAAGGLRAIAIGSSIPEEPFNASAVDGWLTWLGMDASSEYAGGIPLGALETTSP